MAQLADFQARIKKLATPLSRALKLERQGKPEAIAQLAKTLELAEGFPWQEFVEELRRRVDRERQAREAALQARREKLLLAARDAGEPFNAEAHAPRIGIFRVSFEGENTRIELGGVEIERTKEADGEKLFARLKELRKQLEAVPFDRGTFFQHLRAAYRACRQAGSTDDFVPVRDLHREMILERTRSHPAFRKRPEPRNVPPYPLYQFVFDLARFIEGGVQVGEERLATHTPSLRESSQAISIPSLRHPLANETRVGHLAIKRNAPSSPSHDTGT